MMNYCTSFVILLHIFFSEKNFGSFFPLPRETMQRPSTWVNFTTVGVFVLFVVTELCNYKVTQMRETVSP